MTSSNVLMTLDGVALLDPAKLFKHVTADDGDVSKFWNRANSYRVQGGGDPGVGWVLVCKRDIAEFGNLINPTHTLMVTDGQRTIEIKNLAIIKAEAIHAPVPTTPETAYLLTLTDARHFAMDTWQRDDYNLIKYDGNLDAVTADAPFAIMDDIWSHLSPLLGGLTKNESVEKGQVLLPAAGDFCHLENLLYWGISAWEAWWSLLDTYALKFTLLADGTPLVFCVADIPDIKENLDTENEILHIDQATPDLIDWADHLIDPPIPEVITVQVRYRDFQWWKENDRHTPQDHHRRFKIYERTFNVKVDKTAEDRIIKNTNRVIWAPFSLKTDDAGNDIDKDELDDRLEEFFNLHLQCLEVGEFWKERTYSGVWPFEPIDLSAVRWADFGTGLTTKTWDSPYELPRDFKDAVASWDQHFVSPGVPVFVRDTLPHSRNGYGICLGLSPISTPPNDPVPPGGKADVFLQSGAIENSEVKWTDRETIQAYNTTASPIAVDARVFLEFNYQLGTHGEWSIVAADAGGDFIGITTQKIPKGTSPVCSSSGIITSFGKPGTTTTSVPVSALPVGANVNLIQLDVTGSWESCTDQDDKVVYIKAYNPCSVDIEECEMVMGSMIKGIWIITQICCPAT